MTSKHPSTAPVQVSRVSLIGQVQRDEVPVFGHPVNRPPYSQSNALFLPCSFSAGVSDLSRVVHDSAEPSGLMA